jgi:hypothetical protein
LKRTLLNILRRKGHWIGHILRRNCLLHDAIEGQMTEEKRVGRRRTQLPVDLRKIRRVWELEDISIFHKSLNLLIKIIIIIIMIIIILRI